MQEEKIANVEITTSLPVSEWRSYRDLRLRALQNEPQAFASTYEKELAYPDERWQERLQGVLEGKSWAVFARVNGELVGMMAAFRSDDDIKKGEATLVGVYLDENLRGTGMAGRLLDKLLEEVSKNEKVKKIHLSVNEEQVNALEFYKKFGFRVVGEEHLVLGDGKMHKELVMEKEL